MIGMENTDFELGAGEQTALGLQPHQTFWPGHDMEGLLGAIYDGMERIHRTDVSAYPAELAADMAWQLRIDQLALQGVMQRVAPLLPSSVVQNALTQLLEDPARP
jgi:hypothetical protein